MENKKNNKNNNNSSNSLVLGRWPQTKIRHISCYWPPTLNRITYSGVHNTMSSILAQHPEAQSLILSVPKKFSLDVAERYWGLLSEWTVEKLNG